MKKNVYFYSPSESAELIEEVFDGDESAALNWAIDDCRERRARKYCIPAVWEAEVKNGRIKVTRKH